MPHVQMSTEQLEIEYPSLETVEDLHLPDLSRLEDEQLYVAGMRVAQDILHETSEVGRTRRQGGTSDSKRDRQPAQPREARGGTPVDGLPRASGPAAKEIRRRSVGALSGAFTVKCQAPRPHVGVEAAMEPGGSWLGAARPFCERSRPADAGGESTRTRGSGSSSRAPGDSCQDRSHTLGLEPWHLPLCGNVDVNRDGAENSCVENYPVRCSQAVKVGSFTGPAGSVTEQSQGNSSYPESDRYFSPRGFSRLPRRRAADGAHYFSYYRKARPDRSSRLYSSAGSL